jgi:hypothetical protein
MTENLKYLTLRDALLLFSAFFKDSEITGGEDESTDYSKISLTDPISMQRLGE